MDIQSYLTEVEAIHSTGDATEHSYRAALQMLFSSIDKGVVALNEPKRVKCGAPDFQISRGNIIIGHVEAKDIDKNLSTLKGAEKSQRSRYLKALPNLIYTNCLDFEFYKEGVLISKISIAEFADGININPDEFKSLENLLSNFAEQRPQTITSSLMLAEIMAGKAVLIKDVLYNALQQDDNVESELSSQFKAFKEHLIHDITLEDFSDIYAETIAYGMFAARLHDDSLDTFSRQEALDLLPKSNPFLRSLFGYIAGHDLDDRIKWIIDDLADVFQATNVKKILENFGSLTQRNDPFLHFYETFLARYNPAKRKARGVWYTPEPIVSFIVRAVDDVLVRDFGLSEGLADTSKVMIDWDTGQADKKGKPVLRKKEVHRVQVLDPATGTGTFLAEAIKLIAPRVKNVGEGLWSNYVEHDLIPRIHGFELLMASYAMCHMKLEMIFRELGYQPSNTPPRLNVFLTNSLEEGEREVRDLFMAQWLTREAREANDVKRQLPIMCVIGNPPYKGESSNKGDWIMGLMEAYKKEPGGKKKLKERNPKWINDDYVKFIRSAEHLIEKNGEGILGFITNHGYLDNPTFRGMRWHLLNIFDQLYIVDLHGNSKKKEISPDGKPDKNVFDIQQGVAIIIGVKKSSTNKQKPLAKVLHTDIWGDRKGKYQTLWSARTEDNIWSDIKPREPQYSLVNRDYEMEEAYLAGFSVKDLMPLSSVGIVTARDALTIDMKKQELWSRVQDFASIGVEEAREKYNLGKDVRDWKVELAQSDVNSDLNASSMVELVYRPFDTRWTYYTGNSKGFMCYPRNEVMQHMLNDNIALGFTRTVEGGRMFADAFVFDKPITHHSLSIKEVNSLFPLYIYPEGNDLIKDKTINIDTKIWNKLKRLSKNNKKPQPNEIEVLNYVYGVLYCPEYREKYSDFLKIDFPRIPWPSSDVEFWDIVEKGNRLRLLHLMDPTTIGKTNHPYKGNGDGTVEKFHFNEDKIWINKTQYFDKVSITAWELQIGGYQPAQKWLKDRKDNMLSFDDVKHYQSIIKILTETDRIMKTITMSL